ncbi:Acyl-CoA N-acyltransferase [Mycena venus]|uniref:Acyl-CoA N-acyltransferase n=1 Tax=Mycena venus TaxID=2733690 RepID=A0A8H6X237_9AGAR|nr:Acyl-CoA N-acyltransferase [Mycena venus]
MPDDEASGAHVRIATLEEIEEVAAMLQRAFIASPVQAYFSNAKAPLTTHTKDAKRRAHQTKYIQFLFRRSLSLGGRLTVVIAATENRPARIAGAAIWRPPGYKKPPSLLASLRMGLLSVIMGWGTGVMARISDFAHPIEDALESSYAERKLPGTPEDSSWYLQLTGVDPEFQGKGFLSMLLQEAFQHAPNAVFTLEANTPRARDVYKRYGFEVVGEVIIGKGKVDALGVASSGTAATGFPMYPMIKVP